MSFVKPFITSCQSRYFCHICHFCKNRQPSTCHFLSSHLNIWPNPWWIFAILAILAEIFLYRLNLLFPYNHHLSGIGSCYLYKMPVSVVLFKFCQTLDRFFQKFVDFAKIAFLLTPTINDIPLLSSCFNCCQILAKLAIFAKVAILANYQKAIFPDLLWILAKFVNFATFVTFVKPTIIDVPVSSSCFNFYQNFYKFFPNLSFSLNSQLSTCLVCPLIWILANLKWIVAQFAMFVIIAICQDAPFCHLVENFCQVFDNFLPNSPSPQNLSLS